MRVLLTRVLLTRVLLTRVPRTQAPTTQTLRRTQPPRAERLRLARTRFPAGRPAPEPPRALATTQAMQRGRRFRLSRPLSYAARCERCSHRCLQTSLGSCEADVSLFCASLNIAARGARDWSWQALEACSSPTSFLSLGRPAQHVVGEALDAPSDRGRASSSGPAVCQRIRARGKPFVLHCSTLVGRRLGRLRRRCAVRRLPRAQRLSIALELLLVAIEHTHYAAGAAAFVQLGLAWRQGRLRFGLTHCSARGSG